MNQLSRSFVALLATAALTSTAAAQGDWTELKPTLSPSARGNTQYATDAVNLYVFGGNKDASTFHNDLWAFRVNAWVELTKDGAAGSPAKRRWGSACWDYSRNELVIFGGQDVAKKNLGDTWVYSGGKWVQKAPAVSPSPRRWAVMAYDWANGRVLLFGGYGTANMNDTWAWNGTTWTKLSPKTSPPIKSRAGFVSLQKSKEILMYGGTTTTSTATPTTEMWKWDGSDWSSVKQSGGPTSGVEITMTYDDFRDVVLTHGGHNVAPRGDTYEWDGANWRKLSPSASPGNRTRPAFGYVSALKRTIVFGGYTGALPFKGDTWIFETDKPAGWKTSGSGCGTTPPTLSLNGYAWTSGALDVEVNAPASSVPVMVLGFSDKMWGPAPLPLPLSFLGAPSCSLYASVDILVPGKQAVLPIPANVKLAGIQVFAQGIVFDTSFKTSATQLGTATIGVK